MAASESLSRRLSAPEKPWRTKVGRWTKAKHGKKMWQMSCIECTSHDINDALRTFVNFDAPGANAEAAPTEIVRIRAKYDFMVSKQWYLLERRASNEKGRQCSLSKQ